MGESCFSGMEPINLEASKAIVSVFLDNYDFSDNVFGLIGSLS